MMENRFATIETCEDVGDCQLFFGKVEKPTRDSRLSTFV